LIKDFHKHIPKSKDYETRKEIELIIDKIIRENREKLEFAYNKNKKIDIFNSFLDGRNHIYYVKENEENKKNSDEKKDEDIEKDDINTNEEAKENIDVFKTEDISKGEKYNEILSDIKKEVERIRSSENFIEQEVDRIIKSSEDFIEKVAERVVESLAKENFPLKSDKKDKEDKLKKEPKTQKDHKELTTKPKETTEKIKPKEITIEKKPFDTDLKKKDVSESSSDKERDIFGDEDDVDRGLKEDRVVSDLEKKAGFAPIKPSKPDFKVEDASNASYPDEKLIGKKLKEYLDSGKIVKKHSDFEKKVSPDLFGSGRDELLAEDEVKEVPGSGKEVVKGSDFERKDVFSILHSLSSL